MKWNSASAYATSGGLLAHGNIPHIRYRGYLTKREKPCAKAD